MYNITKKRVPLKGDIVLNDADGTPMDDGKGNPLSVTVHSPASKQWDDANAEMNRKRAERMRKAGNKIEAALEDTREDTINFLCSITVKFNNFDYSGKDVDDPIRALYEDDALRFVRDHVFAEANNWSAFTQGRAKS